MDASLPLQQHNSAVAEPRCVLQTVLRSEEQVCVLEGVSSNSRACELPRVLISMQPHRKLCRVKIQSMARRDEGKHSAGAWSYDVNKMYL